MKKHLSYLVGIFIHPRDTIENIANDGSIYFASGLLFILCIWFAAWFIILNALLIDPTYISDIRFQNITIGISKFTSIQFILWLGGYGIMAIVGFIVLKKWEFKKILLVGGYLLVLGMPFWTYYLVFLSYGGEVDITHNIDIKFVGLPFPILYSVQHFLNHKIYGSENLVNFMRYLGNSIIILFYLWIIRLVSMAVKCIYKVPLKQCSFIVITSTIIVGILLWFSGHRLLAGALHMVAF
jgi:hypothetical protein